MTDLARLSRDQVRDAAVDAARAAGVPVRVEEPLAPHLTLRVGGPVPAFLEPRSREQLVAVTAELESRSIPHRILGGGSNVVALDSGLDFAVVHAGAVSEPVTWSGSRAVVPAGTPVAVLLREAIQRGFAGLEWAAGLPGTIGGAVAGNAGAFGGDMAGSVREVVLLRRGGGIRRHVPGPGDFGYRQSFVREGEVVLEVVVELAPADGAAVRAETDRVNRARASSQPKGGHSAGCMFKNPPGDHAGRLIDQCGLKGLARGGARVASAHANFVVNDGTATGADIVGLIDEVRRRVREATGVDLEPEVKTWRGEEEGP